MATKTIQIADKPTLDSVNNKVGAVETSVGAVSAKTDEIKTAVEAAAQVQADKTTLDAVKETVSNNENGISELLQKTTAIKDGLGNVGGVMAKYAFKEKGLVIPSTDCTFPGGTMVVVGDELHVIAGTGHYKWDGISWARISTLPYYFYNGSVVVLNGEIHILGGDKYTSTLPYSPTSYHYKWDGSSWRKVSTLPFSFRNGAAVVLNGEIHIMGGDGSIDSTVHYINSHYVWNGEKWTAGKSLPVYDGYHGVAAVVLNEEIHILGGRRYYSSNSTCYSLDDHYKLTENSWIKVSKLPYTVYSSTAVILNNEIHILGGHSDDSSCSMKHYKWDGTEWTEVSTLPYSFYDGSAVVLNGEIHIANNTYHYKWNEDSWSSAEGLPYDFYKGSAVVLNDEIHILGGNTYFNGSTKDNNTYHYKWDGTEWTEVSTLPYAFGNGAAVVLNGEIHIMGGRDTSTNKYENCTKHYKWNGTEWTEVSTLPYSFYNGSAVVLNGEIHILGGDDVTKTSSSTYNECFTCHYKWDGTEWIKVSALPYNFYYGSAVVLNGEIHILESTKHYKWDGTEWTEASTLPVSAKSVTVLNGEIHIMGGGYSVTSGSTTVYHYNTHYKWDGTEWTDAGDLVRDVNSTSLSAVVLKGKIHLLRSTNYHEVVGDLFNYISFYLPDGKKIMCDPERYSPVSDNLKKEDNGYVCTGEGMCVLATGASEDAVAFTIV